MVDLNFISYFAPLLAFLIVFIVSYVVLSKVEFFSEGKLANVVVSFIIASLFVSMAGVTQYTLTIIPWFAALIVSLVLIVAVIGFVGAGDKVSKGVGAVFIILLGLVFLVSAFVVFSDSITPYLPGPQFGSGESLETTIFLDWLYSPRVAGAILLLVLSVIVGWVLVKGS